ncbi:hypothetical protein N7466_000632 [Penicillium verhagenii]|uniref:uncharacterized protein n=1 Tax=Penicillium verhagenii TaxID=1562060 RepID=UPI0025451584|nr:uncharacterized protein N7466_000632 [Penicillium verhagenii]KAJ5947617.1 hypothetical protein N7466_000632 [Penicillium verhagenii]
MAGSILWPLLGVLIYFFLRRSINPRLKHIPIVRYRWYVPDVLNRLIFYPRASSMIYRGYKEYPHRPFRVLTGDGEIVVLPVKYLPELRHLPPSVISSLDAQYENALGEYTQIIINSYLPSMTVRKRLTPSLARVIPWVIDELHRAFDAAIPECEDHWARIYPHEVFIHLITCATSRVMAGDSLSHNKEWLKTATNYSVNVGVTILLLRPFPVFLRPIVAFFLPSVRAMKRQLRFVKDLFVPMINERRAAREKATAENDPGYEAPDDFLQWMMDMAEDEQDMDPELLAHHMLLLMSLAVVHTSSMAMSHALYDLILMPEYLGPLREEVRETLKFGWENATKASFDNQRRMDSFLKESQRFGPPGELTFHRILKKPLTLSGDLFLPEGTHICFPAGPLSKDPAVIADPQSFDGFRWCRNPTDRHALSTCAGGASITDEKYAESNDTEESWEDGRTLSLVPSTSTSFVSISPSSMHFGAGRQACPGRFFAACTIKAIFSKIIMDYEFKYEDGRGDRRPQNLCVGEHILPNTSTPVLFRKRAVDTI